MANSINTTNTIRNKVCPTKNYTKFEGCTLGETKRTGNNIAYRGKSCYKNGNIDKTVYFVSRVDRKHHLERNQNIDFLYTKGGFVFYKRTSNN